MRKFLLALTLAGAPTGAVFAQGVVEKDMKAEAQMMRDLWRTNASASAKVSLRLYDRQIVFAVPRGYVPVYQAQAPGQFLVEYVPDGETVERWSTMITVRALARLGTLPLSTSEIAEKLFRPAACTKGAAYQDVGEAQLGPGLTTRIVTMSCENTGPTPINGVAAGQAEHGAAYVARGYDHVYTVSVSRRGSASGDANSLLEPLGKVLLCADDSTVECKDARLMEKVRQGLGEKR